MHQRSVKGRVQHKDASVPNVLQRVEIKFLKEFPNANASQFFQFSKAEGSGNAQKPLRIYEGGGGDDDDDVLSGVFPSEA